MSQTGAKTPADLDNHSNQLNPNNKEYKGGGGGYGGEGTKADLDNHSNQGNPNNKEFGGGGGGAGKKSGGGN